MTTMQHNSENAAMSSATTPARAASHAVSVVVPILNAAGYLPELLSRIAAQEPTPPMETILVDSGSTDNPAAIIAEYPEVRLIDIADFSHGRARNLGARSARGDIVVLMTQDALPHDNHWLTAMLTPFDDPAVAAVFSRQIPRDDAPPTEKFFLNYHFPPGKPRRWPADAGAAPAFGRTVFFSNVSSAVRRTHLLSQPFDETLIMSEDQQLARDLLSAGHAIVYQPDSVVIHSHRYTLRLAFRRYFDSVYSLTLIFPEHDMNASASLGIEYLCREARFIARHHPFYLPYYTLYTLAKTAGTIAGHYAERMPRRLARCCSLHRYHWK